MNDKVRIMFGFEDELGNEYNLDTSVKIYYDIGETVLSIIGEKLNSFLGAVGFVRKNDYMLMEDLTEDELDYLESCLSDYRQNGGKEHTKEVDD